MSRYGVSCDGYQIGFFKLEPKSHYKTNCDENDFSENVDVLRLKFE